MKGRDFKFDYFDRLSCLCHKISLNRGWSYTGSPDLMRNKIATINPINKCDDKRFQYAATVVLNHKDIGKNLERISKIKKREEQIILLMILNRDGSHCHTVTKL